MSFEFTVKTVSTFLLLALSSNVWGDVFDFVPDADTANGGSGTFATTTTQSGVTMTYTTNGSSSGTLVIVDGGGVFGTTDWTHGNGTGDWTVDTITFSKPVDITSFYFTSQGASYTANFIVTQGSGTAINNYTVVQGPAPEATITPTDWTGVTAFTISSPIPVTQGSALDQLVFTIANTTPTIGGTAAGYTANDSGTVLPFPSVTIGDADGDNVTTIVTLDTNAKGVFTPASLTASGFTGTGPYTLAATTVANAQTKIRQLVFDPADNRVAPTTTETTTFTITVNDGTAADVTNNTTTVVSTSINDSPTFTGTPSISGTAVVGGTLSAANTGVTDPDPTDGIAYTYQWKANGTNVAVGGTASTYTVTTAEAHKTISLDVLGTDNYTATTGTATTAGVAVANAAPVNTALPVVSGTATLGNTLSTTDGTWTDADADTPTYSYQWKRGTTNVGANSNSYTLTSADAHASITVVVTANDGNGGSTNATSAVTTVANTAPVNTVLPAISGTATVGNSLNASTGTWTDADGDTPTYSYQWKRGTTNVGTSSNSYTLTSADALASITVVVTANDGNGGSTSATSAVTTVANTAPVNTALPVVTGNVLVGATLSTTDGIWTDADNDALSYTYQWKADNVSIVGANNSNYLLTSSEFGAVITVTVTANDNNGGSDAATSAATVAVDGDLDSDNIGDSVDPDIDGDGMSNAYEDANGLNKLDASDRDTDLDGDGVSNFDESNAVPPTAANADDYPPTVTPPADVSIDATGLYTAVDVGTGSANDVLDGAVTSTSNASSHFAPGAHMVTWSATDAAGNTGTATQFVNVVPLVNLSIDQTAREGDTITIKAILNGDAVAYPVDVPYTVSGSADGSDHNMVDGTITINSPDLEAIVSIDLVDDGAGEGDETLIVTMGTPTNAVKGSSTVHTATITETNVEPDVVLSADQGSGTTTLVAQADGSVIVTAAVTDSTGDTHSYDWTATDNALSDTDGAADTFSFDQALLLPGVYTLRVAVTDNNSGSSEADLTLNVVASAPLLTATDTDGDGTNDDVEGYGDEDNDGIINYLDHGTLSSNVMPGRDATTDQFLMETESGLKIRVGKVAFRAGKDSTNVNENDVTIHANDGAGASADSLHDYSSGMFDFIINKLPSAGQSVRVVFAQHASIPANAIYRKYANGVWQDFVEDDNNSLASASGAEGYCPPPGDAAYTAGLTEGDWCVQLTIEDGGPNDADGKANRSIADPGGITEPAPTAEPVPTVDPDDKYSVLNRVFGGGVSSPFWLLMLVGLLAARRLQGRKTHSNLARRYD